MNLDTHPLRQIIKLLKYKGDATLQFGEYSYKPQEILDERRCFDIAASALTDQWMTKQFNELPENKEIAFHSLIKIEKKSLHMPMIDFCCQIDELDVAKDMLSKLLPTYMFASLRFYSSGRSMHAYGSTLLRPVEWREFMGRLLLANMPGSLPLIDARWIGHRIIGGYSALRFSCNSENYLQYPKLLD